MNGTKNGNGDERLGSTDRAKSVLDLVLANNDLSLFFMDLREKQVSKNCT